MGDEPIMTVSAARGVLHQLLTQRRALSKLDDVLQTAEAVEGLATKLTETQTACDAATAQLADLEQKIVAARDSLSTAEAEHSRRLTALGKERDAHIASIQQQLAAQRADAETAAQQFRDHFDEQRRKGAAEMKALNDEIAALAGRRDTLQLELRALADKLTA